MTEEIDTTKAEPTWGDPELDALLTECRRLHRGSGRCDLPDYLMARHRYHAALVKRGILDRRLAEKRPPT